MTTAQPQGRDDIAGRELSITRLLDAPRELVFRLFTDPLHLANWWGPDGFTITTKSMDVRPGGLWLLVMHGPDGRDYNNRVRYVEVKAPERLVFRHEPEKDDEPVHHETFVTLADEGGKTRLHMQMIFPTQEALRQAVQEYKVAEGLKQTIGRLEELIKRQ